MEDRPAPRGGGRDTQAAGRTPALEARPPLPGAGRAMVVVPAPAAGPGNWAGAPSAVLDEDGGVVLAYRIRLARGRGVANVIARSSDGKSFRTVCTLESAAFSAASLERPSLVRTEEGTWRLYVSCAMAKKAWRVDLLEADDPVALDGARARTVLAADGGLAKKDPVVRHDGDGYRAWVCCHPLDEAGEEDRMRTVFMTSGDGVSWEDGGVALEGRAGRWDARGARVTAVTRGGWATYDGRATKAENFSERTGLARLTGEAGRLRAEDQGPVSQVRYVEILELADGGCQLFYEAPSRDGSHELRGEIF